MSVVDDARAPGVHVPEVRSCVSCGAAYRSGFSRCPNDGAELRATETDPLLGSSALEPYVIEELLGEGSMGRVYRARHARLATKHYALKVLWGDLAAAQSARLRFAKEAQHASVLDHPNVVSVVDFGRSKKGLLYIAMELVDGVTLGDLIADGPLEPTRAIRIARGIAAGLAYAHDQHLIHRDLKPDNVLIVESRGEEVARIVDFGIAISADPGDARLTATGFTLGTPAYVAPEATTHGRVDHRADLYGLGVTLYEMLTARLPFDGTAMEQVVAKSTRNPPTMIARAPGVAVPEALERVVGKLMARRPGGRYADAREVITELDRISDATVVTACADTDYIPVRSPRRLVATAGVLALAVAAFALWPVRSAPTATPVVSPTATIVVAPAAPAPTPPVTVVPVAAGEPASVTAAATAERDSRRERRERHDRDRDRKRHRTAAARPASIADRTPVAAPAPTPALAFTPPPAPVVIAPASAPPSTPVTDLDTRLGVAVDGALAAAVARRAVQRTLPGLRRCAQGATASVVEVRFSVGENRRAANVRASGSTPRTRDCVSDVIAGVRSEAAPDIGDATVTVRVAFSAKPQ